MNSDSFEPTVSSDSGNTVLPKELPALSPGELERRQQQVLNGGMMAALGELASQNPIPGSEGANKLEEHYVYSPGDLDIVRKVNSDQEIIEDVEISRGQAYSTLRSLFRLGLLPDHPRLNGEEMAIKISSLPIRLASLGITLGKRDGAYFPSHREISIRDTDAIIVLHELIHATIEDIGVDENSLGHVCSSLREAVVEYIAHGGSMATSKNGYEDGGLDGESKVGYARRAFRDMELVASSSKSYHEDMRLLVEVCDGDFDRFTKFVEALFDAGEVDGLEDLMEDRWGVSMGLNTDLSSLRQIGLIIDGEGTFAGTFRAQMLEAFSDEGVKIDKDIL
jgi:hypothetical protein